MPYDLAVKLTVLCSGTDAAGKSFQERTRTTAIDRSGGRLLTRQNLQPGTQLQLCLLARPDLPTKVILGETIGTSSEGTEWSFHFAGPVADFWGVRFPDETAALADTAPRPNPEAQSAGAALVQMTGQLVLLAAHADDHLRYCTQEMEALRQRFERELQGALDSGVRQLRQVARSTMETTFRSLLEDLARRAAEAVDENLSRLRKGVDETGAQFAKYLNEEGEACLERFQDRLEKHGKQTVAHLEQLQAQGQQSMQEVMQAALADFQAGVAGLLKDLLHAFETHKASRPAAARRK